MTEDLKKMAEHAVDLSQVGRQLDEAADRAIQEQQAREYANARAWHRAMRRAFKGIYPDRLRLANLARYNQEHGDA